MTTLIVVQTIFYFLASITMVAIGILVGIAIYYLISILRNTRDLTEDVKHTYHRTKKNVNKIISSFSKKNKHEKE